MLDVLSFVYNHYWHSDACPELPALHRKLCTVGFDDQEILAALHWLEDLKNAAQRLPSAQNTAPLLPPPQHWAFTPDAPSSSMRLLTPAEQRHVGQESWGFLQFLVSAKALPPERLELVLDRLMAAPGNPLSVEDLKLVVLMVFWSLGEAPSALVLDELCDHTSGRIGH